MTRRHVTNAVEFTEAGLLLAGGGRHDVRVLGAFAQRPAPPGPSKEELAIDAVAYDPFFAGDVRGTQQDPDERPFHPQLPAPHLSQGGELEFLTRDWSGMDLATVVIPELPEAPSLATPRTEPPRTDPGSRWRAVLGPQAREGNEVVELIDGPETFRSMLAAIRTATGPEHYIYLLGWWLDIDVALDVPTPPVCPPPAGPTTIRSLFTAASAAGVQVRVILWDQKRPADKNDAEVAFVNSLANGAGIVENHHVFLSGSHHQKALVVKGSQGLIAFCGGIDLNADRICAPAPAAPGTGSSSSGSSSGSSAPPEPDPGAVAAASSGGGGAGSPLHDVHCRIAGPAAHDLLGVFVKRWLTSARHGALDAAKGALRALAEPVPPVAGHAVVRIGETFNGDATLPAPPSPTLWRWWPAAGPRTFRDRTVQEILVPVIAAARRFIYLEDQYLISMCAAEALRLALPNVDHITILIAASEISDLPRRWEFRQRFIDRIRSHPQGSKLRVFHLCDPGPALHFGAHTYVHAKCLVADDEVAVIGSANVNRRGWETDSEVVAGILGPARDGTPLARKLRLRLWSEHLGVPESAVSDPVTTKGLWLTAPTRRVREYVTTAGSDQFPETMYPESVIDPDFPHAGSPCAGIGTTSGPPATPDDAVAPAPAPTPAPAPAATVVDRWGGYDLRRADSDREPRWAGAVRSAAAGDEVPAAGTDGFVRRLQNDLIEAGFLLVGTPDGGFGRATEWAVREFQTYAKMRTVVRESGSATVYSDRLSPVPNTVPYAGRVSGVLNAATRAALSHWLDNDWRCPVVVEARTGTAVAHANLWGKDDLRDSAPRMVARDWSGHYALPAGVAPGDRMDIGDWQSAGQGGPSSRAPAHTRPDAELTPEALVGAPLASLGPAQLSTYKVVRAVAEVECMGFFDSLNAWDNAILSLGPCHWTLGLVGNGVDRGELCAYLAYLRHFEPAGFAAAMGFAGLRPDRAWATAGGAASGAGCFDTSLRKYTAWLEAEDDAGGFAGVGTQAADANFLRTWHWFYRFVMAGRTLEPFRRRMWDMARIRLRDIRATPWGPGLPAGTTIGDVYTSERALAMVMRWHVYRPAHMISGGQAGPHLRAAFARATVGSGAPGTWTTAHERSLIEALTAEAAALGNQNLIDSLAAVRDWHTWGAGGGPRHYALAHTIADVDAARSSFTFDGAGLPVAP